MSCEPAIVLRSGIALSENGITTWSIDAVVATTVTRRKNLIHVRAQNDWILYRS